MERPISSSSDVESREKLVHGTLAFVTACWVSWVLENHGFPLGIVLFLPLFVLATLFFARYSENRDNMVVFLRYYRNGFVLELLGRFSWQITQAIIDRKSVWVVLDPYIVFTGIFGVGLIALCLIVTCCCWPRDEVFAPVQEVTVGTEQSSDTSTSEQNLDTSASTSASELDVPVVVELTTRDEPNTSDRVAGDAELGTIWI